MTWVFESPVAAHTGDPAILSPTREGAGRGTSLCREELNYGSLPKLLVGAILDEVVDNGRIGKRGRVSETVDLICGNLAQNTAHDFS